MPEIAHPPRRMEMNLEDRERVEELRERGKRLWLGMSALAPSVDQPSAKATVPRKAGRRRVHNTTLVNRTWIERREEPRFRDPDETKTHMWFRVETLNTKTDNPITGPQDYFGITRGGKLLPLNARDQDVVSFDTQAEIIDEMFTRLGAIQQATGQVALQAAA